MRKPYRVVLSVLSDQEYNVEANTPEEAEMLAEQLLEEDGEQGNVLGRSVEASDAEEISNDEYQGCCA